MTDTKTTETTTEEWLYAGQRLDANDKPYDVWLDPEGEERNFKKLAGSMPGHAYAIAVIRDGDRISVRGAPRYLGTDQATRTVSDTQLERWRVETIAAKQILEGKRVEKAAAGEDELQQAIETIRRHRARIRSYAKRGAFDSYILGETARPPQAERED